MEKIPTADNYLKRYIGKAIIGYGDISHLMIEFAKLHVKAALKEASEKGYITYSKFGDEIIHTRLGKFNCYKLVPVVQTGRLFKNEEDVNFWVTKDANKIPILVKAKIPVGYIKMHLVEWSGLKSSASSRVK